MLSGAPQPSCTAHSGSGVQHRDVVCVNGAGNSVVASRCSSVSPPPPSVTDCFPSDSPCRCESDVECGPHMVCAVSEGVCTCGPGWGGGDCSVPLLQAANGTACADGVVTLDGACCTGFVDAMLGVCCPDTAVTDRSGRCCAPTAVDTCSVCNGTGVAMDVQGTCCQHPLPPSGVCCRSGRVDSCGVCGGDMQIAWRLHVSTTRPMWHPPKAEGNGMNDASQSAFEQPALSVNPRFPNG